MRDKYWVSRREAAACSRLVYEKSTGSSAWGRLKRATMAVVGWGWAIRSNSSPVVAAKVRYTMNRKTTHE